MDYIQECCIDHEQVSNDVKMQMVSPKAFQKHLEKIPKNVMKNAKMHSKLPPTTAVCERIDDLIVDALAYWALRDV